MEILVFLVFVFIYAFLRPFLMTESGSLIKKSTRILKNIRLTHVVVVIIDRPGPKELDKTRLNRGTKGDDVRLERVNELELGVWIQLVDSF
jgi:hypothetical protein